MQDPDVVVEVRAPLGQDGGRTVWCQVQGLLAAGRPVVCDVTGPADLGVVDLLARLHVAARDLGASLRLRSAADDLRALLVLTGLSGVVGARLEPGGHPEAGEQRGTEEAVDVRDLPA